MAHPKSTSRDPGEARPEERCQRASERRGVGLEARPEPVEALRGILGNLPAGSIVVLAAHPDDETIGAGALLHRLRGGLVVHLTDGAPHDARFRSADVDRTAYARLRRRELECALAAGGIPPGRALSLGATDQEAALDMAELARVVASILRQVRPSLVVTHPYEGGHPDHDAAALVARAAIAMLRTEERPVPRVIEMTSYHGASQRLVTGSFLGCGDAQQVTRPLTRAEQGVKRAMLSCFESQREVLAPFTADVSLERFRPAPAAHFGAPPHDGPLWYEQLGFPIRGESWRALARRALHALRLEEALA